MSALYQLYNKDCVEVIPTLKAFDVIVTDPPYPNNSSIFSEMIASWFSAYEILKVTGKPMVIFWDTLTQPCQAIPNSRHVFHKSNGYNAGKWEAINIYLGDDVRRESLVLSYPTIAGTDWERAIMESHPTAKPIKLMKWLIEKYTKYNEIVFDPFMGSGTTGVAALQLGRKFIGCEIDPSYFAIAEKRIKQAAQQPVLMHEAQQSVHLTASGAGGRGDNPLQSSFIADDPSAKHGGR